GSVAHNYLKYDSPMYQDILTSLAVSDERLSENIAGLSNCNSTQSQAQDTNSNNTPDIETIEHRAKLIVDTQNLYEKKALKYGGIAGTHEVYRDYWELMIKHYSESHGKVALYKDIVRDVSILHSAQLGMNISDLPDSHHKEMAGAIYNNIDSYKASSGRGQSEHNIDNHDKAKIAEHCYQQLCSSKVWSDRALNSIKVADELLSSVKLGREANVATLLEQEKHKIKDILKLNPKFDQEALKQTLAQAGVHEQEAILSKVWLGEFKAKVLPELDVLHKEKAASKTVNELIGVFKNEKEYCLRVEKAFPALTQTLDHQEQNSHIALAATHHTVRPKMIEEMHADILILQKYSGWSDGSIISTINMHQDISRQTDAIFNRTQSHIIDSIEDNLHKFQQQHQSSAQLLQKSR
ncbi:MAG: MobA/MobL family protein, partial [Rickettsia sp.]